MNNNFHYSLKNKEILRRVISRGMQSRNNQSLELPISQSGSEFNFDLEGLNINNPDLPLNIISNDSVVTPLTTTTQPFAEGTQLKTPLTDSILNSQSSKYNTKGLNSEDLGKLSTSLNKDLESSANAKNNPTLDKTVKTVGNAVGMAVGVPGLGEIIGLVDKISDASNEPARKRFANKEASNLASGNLNKYRWNRIGRKGIETQQKYGIIAPIAGHIGALKEAINPDLSDFYNYQDAKKKRNEALGVLNNKGEMLSNPMYSTAQNGGIMRVGNINGENTSDRLMSNKSPIYMAVSTKGLLEYPNQSVVVPTNNGRITMKFNNLPNKVLAINAENNQPLQVMEKGKDYQFRYKNGKVIKRILEIPLK